jgi:small subunit ribosomal protein S2
MSEDLENNNEKHDFLLPQEVMLSAGIHIGTRMKTKDIDQFIYRVRPDGLFVLNVRSTDERLKTAAKFFSRFDPSKIVVVATRIYARVPTEKFTEFTGTTPIIGRFNPGLFTNPLFPGYMEPEVVFVSDPQADTQAVKEAATAGIPVVALCSTDNDFRNIDLVIPTNNKGRKALAVIYWVLARQILREKEEIPSDGDLPVSIDDFEAKLVREEIREKE